MSGEIGSVSGASSGETRGPGESVSCTTIVSCTTMIEESGDARQEGVSGTMIGPRSYDASVAAGLGGAAGSS